MIRRNTFALFAVLLMTAFFGLATANAAQNAAGGTCDRACLAGFVTKYVDALIAHNPGALQTAPNTRFTEDCKELKLGDGMWKKTLRLTDYRRDILDVRQGVAVSFLVVEENSSPIFLVLRLKISRNSPINGSKSTRDSGLSRVVKGNETEI